MDLPSTPNKFNSGEFLTAAKLNKIVEWIKAAEREIRANEIKPGAGLTFTRTAAGTSISAVHRFIPEADSDDTAYPFRVSLTYEPADEDSQLGAPAQLFSQSGRTVSVPAGTAEGGNLSQRARRPQRSLFEGVFSGERRISGKFSESGAGDGLCVPAGFKPAKKQRTQRF